MVVGFSAGLLDRLRRTIRGRNALFHIFELWVGLAGILSGVVFFYSPAAIDHNAVAVSLSYTAAAIWSIGYFAAGLGVWWGLLRPSPRIEVVALWLLGTATSINGITILAVFGLRGAATALTLLTLTAASWLRALLVQTDVLRLAKEQTDEPA
jgi:hypothetical protein